MFSTGQDLLWGFLVPQLGARSLPSLPRCHVKGTHSRGAAPPSEGDNGLFPHTSRALSAGTGAVPLAPEAPQTGEGRGAIGTDSRMSLLRSR